MSTFTFTLLTKEGNSYTYTGSLAGLYQHMKANEHLGLKVVEEATRFTGNEAE